MDRLMWTRAGAIVAILAASAVVAAEVDIGVLKETAIRAALDKQGNTGDNTALIASTANAAAITSVEVNGLAGATEVIITTDGQPEYTWFALDSGKRVVIDFLNTIHLQSGLRLAPIGAGQLERVRSSLFALEPSFTSRIVIDLRSSVEPEFSLEENRLVVRIGPAKAIEDPAQSEEAVRIANDLTQAEQAITAARQRIEQEISDRALLADANATDELRAFVAEANEAGRAAETELAKLVDESINPLAAQRARFDELQAAQYAKTISGEKAATTLESIDAEVKHAATNADQALTALETAFVRASEGRQDQFEVLVAKSIAPAPEVEPVATAAHVEEPKAPIVEVAMIEQPVVAPEPDATGDTVASAIAKIEQDLAAVRDGDAAPDVVEVATVVEEKPLPAAMLAKLDGLTADMAELSQVIEAAAAPEVDSTEELATTESVPLELVQTPVQPPTVSASVAAPGTDQPMMLAQAEASPEPTESGDTPVDEADESMPAEEPSIPAEGTGDEQPVSDVDAAAPAESVASGDAVPAAPPTPEAVIYEAPQSEPMAPPTIIAAPSPAEREDLPPGMDPLDQLVNIDFREMDLSSVISLLAKKAQVNVIAGTEVSGTVTADIRNVPLRKAMDMVLRMNGLGIVEEEGIFRIVPYEEAVASRRMTRMVVLTNAQAEDVRTTLEGILVGGRDAKLVSISANKNTNVIIVSGPEDSVAEFERLARELDVKEPTLPTVTEAIKLNYLDPKMAKPILETIKTDKIGKVEIDQEGRHVIVTDIPAAVEQMRALLVDVDLPVKQVAIEAMIVDAVLRDASQTGVDWTVEAIRRHSSNGDLVSDLSQLSLDGNLGNIGTDALDAGVLQLGILSSEVRINAAIAAEVQSRNAEILANPSIVTVENNPAMISIVQEFPYQEITQGLTGPPVASTEFKPIGVTLEVTPRITHANDTIVEITAKQSSVSGLTESGVPIEDKREATTKLRAENGRTIFIGGLRNVSDRLNVSKIPVLGDIPVLNFLFRNTDTEKVNTELLIFLTCHVMNESLPELSATQSEAYDKLDSTPKVPDAQRANFRDIVKPQEMRDPMWKWRRSNR